MHTSGWVLKILLRVKEILQKRTGILVIGQPGMLLLFKDTCNLQKDLSYTGHIEEILPGFLFGKWGTAVNQLKWIWEYINCLLKIPEVIGKCSYNLLQISFVFHVS